MKLNDSESDFSDFYCQAPFEELDEESRFEIENIHIDISFKTQCGLLAQIEPIEENE